MLGVTRIYSRKVQYLLDDCKETRERIALVGHTFLISHGPPYFGVDTIMY
jgi:cohesin complex subunit SCC1